MMLLVMLWLVALSDGVGAFIAGRRCLQIRNTARLRVVYGWFTAFGVGLYGYAVASLGSTANSIVNGSRTQSALALGIALFWALVRSAAVWTIALALLNGNTPDILRRVVFRVLRSIGGMKGEPKT